MSILPSVAAATLVEQFLEKTRGLSHVEAARMWGVNPSYIRQLRHGKRVQWLHASNRESLVAALERLDVAESSDVRAQLARFSLDSPIASRLLLAEARITELAQALARLTNAHQDQSDDLAQGHS